MLKFLFSLIFLINLYYVKAQCPPKESDIKVIKKYLEASLQSVKKIKPGSVPADADFVINKALKEIMNSKKFSPCNDQFKWSELSKDVQEIRKECYIPKDYSNSKAQKEFFDCAKGMAPPLILKYGAPAINACSCFTSTIVPNWDSKYKKLINVYLEEFKTLKHRKK